MPRAGQLLVAKLTAGKMTVYEVAAATGAERLIGPVGDMVQATSLTFDPGRNALFAAGNDATNAQHIFTMDLATSVVTSVPIAKSYFLAR